MTALAMFQGLTGHKWLVDSLALDATPNGWVRDVLWLNSLFSNPAFLLMVWPWGSFLSVYKLSFLSGKVGLHISTSYSLGKD